MLVPKQRNFIASFLIAGLAGCTTVLPVNEPKFEAPKAFKQANAYAQSFAPAQLQTKVPQAWWLLFKDEALNALQEQALASNQSLAASSAAIKIARAAMDANLASRYPVIGAGFGLTQANSSAANSSGKSANAQLSFSSWEIDLWDRLASNVQNTQLRLLASQDDLAAAKLSMHASIAQTYFSLRTAQAQQAVTQQSIAALTKSLELTQNRYRAGIVAASDVSQATAQLKSTQAQSLELQLSAQQFEHALASLVGVPAAQLKISAASKLPQAPQVPLQVPSDLLQRRPDIAAAARRVAAANAQIGAADAAFFPALTLSANAGYRANAWSHLIDIPNRVWSIGPSLLLPLFDGGAKQAALASAQAAQLQAEAQYRSVVLAALQEVEDNLAQASLLQQEDSVVTEQLAATRKTLEVANHQYAAGTVSYLNVTTAQSAELAAQNSLLSLQNRRLLALNQLLKNLAGSWSP